MVVLFAAWLASVAANDADRLVERLGRVDRVTSAARFSVPERDDFIGGPHDVAIANRASGSAVTGPIRQVNFVGHPQAPCFVHRRRIHAPRAAGHDHSGALALTHELPDFLKIRIVARADNRDLHEASIKPITLAVCCSTVAFSADVSVRIHVQTDPANVAVTLLLDGPEAHLSEFPLSATSPATVWPRPYQRLPEGSYVVTAVLWRHEQRTYEAGRAVARVHIGPVDD